MLIYSLYQFMATFALCLVFDGKSILKDYYDYHKYPQTKAPAIIAIKYIYNSF
jgi:hypothetical protein